MIAALVVFGLLLVVLAYFFLAGRADTTGGLTPGRRPGADQAELEEAERDVRDAADSESVRDWGPGAAKPRPPELL